MPKSTPRDPLPAIPARHSRLAEAIIYRLLVRWPAWSTFDRIWLRTLGPIPQPSDGPLIAYLNHPSWWDGYMAFLLHREILGRCFQSYLMMDERQLRSYRFFSWIGVFSVNIRDPGQGKVSVAYIARRLAERPARCLWIFPQGKLLPNDQRPLHIYPGVARIARRCGGATLWPIALRYEFRNEQRPEAFIRAGPPHRAGPGDIEEHLVADIRSRLTEAADALRDEVTHQQLDDYTILLNGRPGVDRLFGAALRLLPRRAAR